MIVFTADIRSARAKSTDAITTSSVGIPVTLALANDFDGLAKTAVFTNGQSTVDVALVGDATSLVIPPDVLQTTGQLYMGIYAADGEGNIVIPTVWAFCGTVLPGTVPSGVDPADPTPNWVAQVQEIASDAMETAQSVRTDADNGEFDGFSPTITVTDITGGHRVSVTDADGTSTFDVMDGAAGRNGTNGKNGTSVWYALSSPSSIRWDADHWYVGWTTAQLSGRSGLTPATGDIIFYGTYYYIIAGSKSSNWCCNPSDRINLKGDAGQNGTDGTDGYSPTVTVTDITGGHRVTITDVNGAHTFDVMDGTGGGGGAVDSVNGQTGTVVLTASDVGALPDTTTIPTKTSQLQNDSGFLTSAPVSSVNGQTGAVSLSIPSTAADVGAIAAPSSPSSGDVLTYANGAWGASASPTEVAWFTYGTSTSAQIEAAYQAGKVCAVPYNNRVYYLSSRTDSTTHMFATGSYSLAATVTCTNNSWTNNSRSIPAASSTTPSPLGTAAVGDGTTYARSNHVHAMPSASDVGAVAVAQGVGHSGEFLVVGSDGNVTTVTLATWQGGSY